MQEQPVLLEEDGFEDEILVEEETTVVNAMWGDIGGNIENQTDLQNALDAKQDSLTEAQLNAVNSGITAEKVTTYDDYADQIASKADQSALNAEATTREQADTALGTRIDDEATARQQADNGLQSQIDAITSKSDVVDVVANYAALQAYDTSSLGNNDVIKVLDDETHEDALTYYRWSIATQTWTYIGQEAPYYSKGQMDVMLQGKQDKLTAGANIQIQNGTISATDTTYTAGNGLNLNDTEFSADTDVLATKEDLEGYYTKPETDNLLAPKLEAEVVAELPTTGEEGKLYLTPKAHTTQTATGNPITATVAEDAGAIESFQLDGDTFQQSYEGKNLLKLTPSASTSNGITATLSNGVISYSGTATTNWANLTSRTTNSIPAGEYTFSKKEDFASNYVFCLSVTYVDNTTETFEIWRYTGKKKVITFSKDVVSYFAFIAGLVSGTTYSDTMSLMLESGTTDATPYEPYVGGVPSPNQDYPQPIQTVTGLQTVEVQGKNLFDKDNPNIVRGYIAGTLFNGGNDYSVFIPCDENTTYTIQKMVAQPQTASRFRINSYDKMPAVGDSSISSSYFWNAGDGADVASHTYTTPAGAKYLGITVMTQNASGTTTIDDILASIQVELGSTATAYAPYSKQTLPLDLGSIELNNLDDTYLDRIFKDGSDWKIRKNTNRFTFETPKVYGLSKQNLGFTYNTDNNPLVGKHIPLVGKCSHFDVETTDATWTGLNRTGMNSGGALWFRTTDSSQGDTRTSTEFAQWLVDAGVSFVYALETPTDTIITDTDLIAQLEAIRTALLQNGANTISNTAAGSNLAGDMEIGYYGFNPRNRYDKWLWLDINNEYEQIGS